MSTVNVERVAGCNQSGKKLGTTTFTGRNGILCRYFYFAMSLMLAAIVIAGFKRTVNQNLFHPAIARPFILWIHASAFNGVGDLLYWSVCAGAGAQSLLASFYWMVWRRARGCDGSAGGCYRHRHGAL